jgi:hypothetical protein
MAFLRTICAVGFVAGVSVLLVSNAATATGLTQLVEIESFLAPGNTAQMQYSPQAGLLFLRNSGSAIRVIDTSTHLQRAMDVAANTFPDMSLTPDGQYLYATDYGGADSGSGLPWSASYIHRFSVASGQWETKVAPSPAYRIETFDANRFFLLTAGSWSILSLNSWGAAISELSHSSTDYWGDIAYDVSHGRVIYGNSNSSSNEILAYQLVGNSVTAQEGTGVYGSAQNGGGTYVLSSDSQNFYYGRLQVDALDVRNNRIMFPGMIYAASADIAFGQNGYYNSRTGAQIGTLPFTTTVYCLDATGTSLWAFDPASDLLHHYAIVPEPAMLGTVMLGSSLLLTRRSRRSAAPRAHRSQSVHHSAL